ncbi:SpcZ [Streptomyces sp. MST-110588]|uniref:SpcZ n=1 Tax=Streptomyces sp. MST-110588 TaxID=2833628 RepID=UPI001F5CC6DD|nr:SpcZ [Streptomyces sp. MST-110588]UNO43296.1 SpcZ [Streptomyces sp. MST-110588]
MSRPPAAAEAFAYFLAQFEAGMALAASGDDGPAYSLGADLPPWLVQMVTALYEGQDEAAARAWAQRVQGELRRLDGRVPFAAVVHDWHLRTVAPMLAEASVRRGEGPGAQEAVRLLHERALAGQPVGESQWQEALGPALREVYHHAYAYADAFATASANALAYAQANDYEEDKAVEFAEYYAKLNTGANARASADANALAHARTLAQVYATGDERAYATAYPFAYVNAYALAYANRDEAADRGGQDRRRRAAYGRLADGLADSLARAGAAG